MVSVLQRLLVLANIGFNLSLGISKAKLLTERLEAMTFEAMQNPKSALFSNELTKLIKEAKKVGSSATWIQ